MNQRNLQKWVLYTDFNYEGTAKLDLRWNNCHDFVSNFKSMRFF
ncbi:unnamed protein product, partial [Allacma fusca]